jgi:hypothetical protein
VPEEELDDVAKSELSLSQSAPMRNASQYLYSYPLCVTIAHASCTSSSGRCGRRAMAPPPWHTVGSARSPRTHREAHRVSLRAQGQDLGYLHFFVMGVMAMLLRRPTPSSLIPCYSSSADGRD